MARQGDELQSSGEDGTAPAKLDASSGGTEPARWRSSSRSYRLFGYALAVIASLTGVLDSVADGRAMLRCGDITYELLVPACDLMRLSTAVGERISFHTLHYLESQGQGTSFLPRLIGFAVASDRAFFELFTSVKGIGNRKALRAMALPVATMAEAIAERNIDLLKTLPEIGRKTAETIILELREKVSAFAIAPRSVRSDGTGPSAAIAHDAMQILIQLGEPMANARILVDRAVGVDPTITTADGLLTAALRLRDGG